MLARSLCASFGVIVDHGQGTCAVANVLVLLAALGEAGLAWSLDALL
ncbi:MAG TPA: hypothetical protein VGG28_13310 [Kofleriaceae bacterium]